LLNAILPLFPLDTYGEYPVSLMAVVIGDPVETPIWDQYSAIVAEHIILASPIKQLERFAFYERAKKAYAVVSTGEGALYANIIVRKGVIS
jgi:L-fucose mutarotase